MAMKKMGKTMYIRVNTKNCMAVRDALVLAGLNPGDFTLPGATARVLDMLLSAMMKDGLIPDRDGFEYLELMGEFKQQDKSTLPSPRTIASAAASQRFGSQHTNSTQRQAVLRFQELMDKQNHAPDTWTAQDQAELDEVYLQLP